MKKIIILFFYLFYSYLLKAQSLEFDWVKQMGGTSDEAGVSIAVDASGNVYSSGQFNGVTDFDPGPGVYTLTPSGYNGTYVSKLDALGNFVWAKNVVDATTSADNFDLAIDSKGNVYTIGTFFNTGDFDPGSGVFTLISNGLRDIYISKLDPMGNFIWAKNLGGAQHDRGNSIAIDFTGNVYTTGIFVDTADFDPGVGVFNLVASGAVGDCNVFVSKLDSLGNFIWAKNMGGMYYDFVYSITLDKSCNVYTSGVFFGMADFDPNSGVYNLPFSNSSDIFISKLDSSGNFVWAKNIDGLSYVQAYSLSIDDNYNVYVTGTFDSIADFNPGVGTFNLITHGNKDAFVLKLNEAGDFVWVKQIGGLLDDAAGCIIGDVNGNIYSMGVFGGTTDFDPGTSVVNLTSFGNGDAFILKLDSSGNFVWVNSFGGSTDNVPNCIALDSIGGLYTIGWFNGTSDFDPSNNAFSLTSLGAADAFVHKMKISTVGVKENNKNNVVNVCPNPNKGLFTIDLTTTSQVTITNALGQVLSTETMESGKHNIDIHNQATGIYFVKVIVNGNQQIIKLIKE